MRRPLSANSVSGTIPETLSDLETVLLAFKDELGIKYPIYSSLTIYSPVITTAYEGSTAYGSSGFYVDENGTVQCVWLCDDYREMVELMHDWYGKELITSDSITLTGEESAIQGSLTAVWGDNIKTMSHTSEEATTDPNCDIVAMSYPTKEKGGNAYVAPSDYAADPFSVSTNCADPELAIMYVNFFYTPEGQMACNYGIEGDSYVYNENGEPVFTDKVMNNPDGLDISVAQAIYSSFFMPYVHLPSRTASAYTDQDEFDASDIWKQHVDNSHTYRGDLTVTESEAYTAVMSDIETYVDETTPKFINGDLGFDQWDDFMKTIQDMGIEDARVLKQAAYDRYLQR